MIKLLVSDLDGTFVRKEAIDGNFVSDENKTALAQFIRQGGFFVTASGRHHDASYQLMKELGFHFDMVGLNGATIIHNDHLIEHNHPSRTNMRMVVEELSQDKYGDDFEIIAVDLSFHYIFAKQHQWATDAFEKLAEDKIIGGVRDVPLLDWLNDRHNPDPTSVSIMIKDPKDTPMWIERLRKLFDRYFDIYASAPNFVELMKPAINKGFGVRSIARIYGLEEHEIAVVGDNQNDISMFFATPNSYCMSTASPQVQKYASKVVDSVADVLYDVMKKNEAELALKGDVHVF